MKYVITGNFVLLMDADFSHNPKHIAEFIRYETIISIDAAVSYILYMIMIWFLSKTDA